MIELGTRTMGPDGRYGISRKEDELGIKLRSSTSVWLAFVQPFHLAESVLLAMPLNEALGTPETILEGLWDHSVDVRASRRPVCLPLCFHAAVLC